MTIMNDVQVTSSEQLMRAASIEVIGAAPPAPPEKAIGLLRQFLAPFQEIPASTRRSLIGILALLAIAILIAVVTGRTQSASAQPPDAGQAASGANNVPGNPPAAAVLQDNTATPTNVPPTATPFLVTQGVQFSTLAPVVLPPTWTPAATSTSAIPSTPTALAVAPANLIGKLAILSSPIPTTNNFWPVIITAPDGSNPQVALADPDRGEYVQLVPDGKQMIYTYSTVGTDSHILQSAFRNGTTPRLMGQAWNNSPALDNPHGDFLSSDGHFLAFAAQDVRGREAYPGIYVLNVQPWLGLAANATPTLVPTVVGAPTDHVPPGVLIGTSTPPPTQLMTATATPSLSQQYLVHVVVGASTISDWPSIAPSDQFVAFTLDTSNSGENAVDLYVALVQPNSTPLRLTKDGGTLLKGASAWSPDSKQIAFTSTAKDGSYSDIELINADGSARQVLIHQDKTHNIRPHWSPDGKYLAFTSDRTGKDQVFMMDMASHQLYQITHDNNINILSDWASQ